MIDGTPTCLDAADGQVVRAYTEIPTYARAHCTYGEQLILADGVLLAREWTLKPPASLYACDASSGNLIWKRAGGPAAVSDGRVVFDDGTGIVCADLKTGADVWRISQDKMPASGGKARVDHCFGGRVFLNRLPDRDRYGKPVPPLDKHMLYGLSLKDGSFLWEYEVPSVMYPYVVSFEGELWVITGSGRGEAFYCLDPATGKEIRRLPHKQLSGSCSFPRVSANYFISGKGKTDYVNRQTGEITALSGPMAFCSATGGSIPANGLEYFLPGQCMCGSVFFGMAATGTTAPAIGDNGGKVVTASDPPAPLQPAEGDWPSYRNGPARGNCAAGDGPANLDMLWQAKPGQGRLTQPVVSAGLVCAADVDAGEVVAMNQADGAVRWRFQTGGRVDTPPTFHQGMALVGSRDGWVYGLAARSGQLVWKCRAAPTDRGILVNQRLESLWPVSGGVLVNGNLAYVLAGRCGTLDGGMIVSAIEPATGQTRWRKPCQLATGASMLVGDGAALYMGSRKVDPANGAMDDDARKKLPPGILGTTSPRQVAIDDVVWNLRPWILERRRATLTDGRNDGAVLAFNQDASFACNQKPSPGFGANLLTAKGAMSWTNELAALPMALAVAGKTLYGAVIPVDNDQARKSQLMAFSTADGSTVQSVDLPSAPAPDGMAVAGRRVYVSTQDGTVLCFGK